MLSNHLTLSTAANYFSNLLDLSNINNKLEARVLIQHICNINEIEFITNPNRIVLPQEISQLTTAVNKRNTGYPLAYIVGYKDFWKHRFLVDENVLIPRPETEIIIETTLSLVPDKLKKYKLLDIGTGSGCILLSLLQELKNSFGVGIDIEKKALEVATTNARSLQIDPKSYVLINQNLFSSFKTGKQFDLIVSNPPYIAHNDKMIESTVKKFEPHSALFAADKGLFFYKQILNHASKYLTDNGYIVFELGIKQSEAVRNIGLQNNFKLHSIIRDYNGIERIIVFSKSKHV